MKTVKAISVVMPAYNAAGWLGKSIPRVDKALQQAGVSSSEIIIIDDGSTDETLETAKKLKTKSPLRVLHFENGGRFLARKRGTEAAKYDHILFIDTRIYIAPKGLKFIVEQIKKEPSRQVWTTHVHLDMEGNIYARFWEAITFVAWWKYFRNPRDVSYGIKEFDSYPKGTTCFFVPKEVFAEANNWFEKNTKDMKTSNDDTLLIRRIAEKNSININPAFSCIYHARTNFRNFIKHVHHRGKVFVDGFLRRDGNALFYPLVAFLVLSAFLPIVLLLFPSTIMLVVSACIVAWLSLPLIFLLIGVQLKNAASFFILSPVFLVSYGLGIWKAFIKIHVAPLFKH